MVIVQQPDNLSFASLRMNIPRSTSQPWLHRFWKRIDPFSLQFRLTAGVSLVSILGIAGVSLWTAWKSQEILIASHKQLTQDVAKRFPVDVELYSDMMDTEAALQRAIDNRTLPGLVIVVEDPSGEIIAQTRISSDFIGVPEAITTLHSTGIEPKVYSFDRLSLVMCNSALVVNGTRLGTLYVAQDVTTDQVMFLALLRNIGIASGLAIVMITTAIAIYVRRSLVPLKQMGQITDSITVEDLGDIKLQLENAPTEVLELVHTCEKMLMRLAASWDQQRQFVSDVSHELRTPLTVVSGYLQSTLRRCQTLTDPQREALEIASSEADRTIQLLQDLLDLARADSGYFRFSLEPVHLNDLVFEVVGMAEKCDERMIRIEAASSDITVKGDRNRLKQILINLIDNAVKYSDADKPIIIHLEASDDEVNIHIQDFGCGIPLHHQTRIFDRFYRVDEARARSTGGCGLGLSIVKTLVEGMGGSVAVRSKPNQGSTFTVTLPTKPIKPIK
jgi:signal transduction histidine kinase